MKLHIEKAVYGGNGLAHDDEGRAIFVPFVLRGESVDVLVARERSHSIKAQLLQVIAPSPERVDPSCRHFGRCGGCQYQHASYGSQLAIKCGILKETLERARLRGLPDVLVHAGHPWGYRNRIRLRVETIGEEIKLGYNLRDTREFLPIEECPIASSVLWRAAEALCDSSRRNPVCAQWLRATSELELVTTENERSLQMSLALRGEKSTGFAHFCEHVQVSIPELVGAGAGVVNAAGDVSGGVSWGQDGMRYFAQNVGYWVTRGGFFQVNRFLIDELVRVVADGRKGFIAWDLYAGVGLFSRVLARSFESVFAVEASQTAIKDLASAKDANVRGIAQPVMQFLKRAAFERERPDLVVMDPPRAGVGREVCELLVRMQVPQIVYVSCDPTTLARDLRVMVDSGYNLAELHLVDLFPQTYHMETVAVLQR